MSGRLRDHVNVRQLCSSEARGSVLDRLRCVLGDSLTVVLSKLHANKHFEVLCVQCRRLGSDREMGFVASLIFASFSFFLAMSKRNLEIVTCSLTQSGLVEFVEKYGIALCYDPQLPSYEQTALDAPNGYIPLYLSLFSISNLPLPLNTFCLYVFEFFYCHFPLLSPFGVARVTTFVVACNAYGGEPTLPLFRSLCTIGPADDWLTFLKKETFILDARSTFIIDFRHGLATFAYLYPTEPLTRLYEFLRACPERSHVLVDGEEMSFRNFIKKPGQTPTFSVRPADQPIDVGNPSVDHSKFVNDNDLEGDTVIKLVAVGSSSKHESKRLKHEGSKRTSARGIVHPSPVIAPKGVGKRPRVLARHLGSLEGSPIPFVPRQRGSLCYPKSPASGKKSTLCPRNLKLMISRRSQALDEVHGLGDSWDFKDVEDYNPEAKKVFDKAVEAFYKLEFPYIFLFVEKADESLGSLAAVDPPTIQKAPPSWCHPLIW
nr:hypothetical protein [Tanacetum cinerariifolium]